MKLQLLRKVISCIITALIFSLILVLINDYSPFFVYFILSMTGCLIVGVPCSMISDVIVTKFKRTKVSIFIGLALHLIFAALTVLLMSLTESEGLMFFVKYASLLVYAVFAAAAGLWFIDTSLKLIISHRSLKSV